MIYKSYTKMKLQDYKWKGLLAIIISVFTFQVIFAGNVNASPIVHRIAGYTQ